MIFSTSNILSLDRQLLLDNSRTGLVTIEIKFLNEIRYLTFISKHNNVWADWCTDINA